MNNDFRALIYQYIIVAIALCALLVLPFKNIDYLTGKKELIIPTDKNTTRKYAANKKANEKINALLELEIHSNATIECEYEIDNKIIVLTLLNTDETHSTYFIDSKTGKELDIYSLIGENDIKAFYEIVYNELLSKYPKFIADTINLGEGVISYIFSDENLMLFFDNYEYGVILNENIQIVLNYNQLEKILNYEVLEVEEEYNNEFVLSKTKKTIAFTFDDGPSKHTDELLISLYENHANGTFFVVGNLMSGRVKTLQKTLEYGNEIGSHSYDHSYLTKKKVEALEDMHKAMISEFKRLTGSDLLLTRPPYGSINQKVVTAIKTPMILWSLDTRDWEVRDTQIIVDNVLSSIQDGDIVLFHDLYPTTIEAVKILLPILYAEGYQVTTVSKLAELRGFSLEKETIYKNFYSR